MRSDPGEGGSRCAHSPAGAGKDGPRRVGEGPGPRAQTPPPPLPAGVSLSS